MRLRTALAAGMLALLLLIPLAVTSTNGMMRRLGRRPDLLFPGISPRNRAS